MRKKNNNKFNEIFQQEQEKYRENYNDIIHNSHTDENQLALI